jgi:hypothetical protein
VLAVALSSATQNDRRKELAIATAGKAKQTQDPAISAIIQSPKKTLLSRADQTDLLPCSPVATYEI